MTTPQGSIIVDSCQYTPVYLIQNPGAIQGRSFVVNQNHVEEPKPVSDNLKRFYESSGLLENNLVNNVSDVTKPRILKKTEGKFIAKNFTLSNFLVPKVEKAQAQYIPVKNVVLKTVPPAAPAPAPPPPPAPVINKTVPRVEVDRKVVKMTLDKVRTRVLNKVHTRVKPTSERILQIYPERIVHNIDREERVLQREDKTLQEDRTLPKTRPKENIPSPKQKHTSVQLLKLGETYHSLNQLNDEQMKMVHQALKIFNDPVTPTEPTTYDPVTNTRFIYKVVSPRDLTVVGKNKLLLNDNKKKEDVTKKEEIVTKKKEDILKKKEDVPKKEEIITKKEEIVTKKEQIKPPPDEVINKKEEVEPPKDGVKVTRSGRKVKFPKQMLPEDPQQKPRKKRGAVVSCFQCATEFCSFYRLQKHYESHPTHIPAKIHSNLFHCLLAIVKSGSEEDRANMFIQQLEQLIEKLKSLLPCLLKKIDGTEGNSCSINDDIGRLFGMNPGKYNLNMEALACVKNKDGYCCHNPPPKPVIQDPSTYPQNWLTKHEENANDSENEDCARINAVDKWPTASKRLWKIKKKNSENAKRMRLASENTENAVVDLDVEDLIGLVGVNDKNTIEPIEQSAIITQPMNISPPVEESVPIIPTEIIDDAIELNKETVKEIKEIKLPHLQFHSTHFDIRSSPIKPSSAVFCKFQIDSDKIARYEAQVIRPLDLDKEPTNVPENIPIQSDPIQTDTVQSDVDVDNVDIQSILRDEIINLSSKDANVSHNLSFDADKDFFMNTDSNKSDSFMKSNGLIEPSLLHVKDTVDKLPLSNDLDHGLIDNDSDTRLVSQGHSVLNFLESLSSDCLSYPETDIRNNTVDFQLDLFSFHNS